MARKRKDESSLLQLETFLPYRLAVAGSVVSKGLAAVYAEPFQLTVPEWRLLANLGRHGALTAGEAARRSSLEKVQVTRALQRLMQRQLIDRQQGRGDRRQAHLILTAKGRQLFDDVAARALVWERELLAALSPTMRHALGDALDAVAERARQLAPVGCC